MVRIITIFFIFLYSFNLFGNELTNEEKLFFNFADLNKDKSLSLDELNYSLKLIFQILDENHDLSISEIEIIEFKNLIKSFEWVFGGKY